MREIFAPARNSRKTSRPSSSVPSQCSRDGGWKIDAAVVPTSVGSNGNTSGPMNAITKMTASRISPIFPVRSRQIWRNVRPVTATAPVRSVGFER